MPGKLPLKAMILILCAAMVLSVMPSGVLAEDPESGGEKGKNVYDSIMNTEDPPAAYTADVEPYGHGKDEPFFMVEKSELLLYGSYNDGFLFNAYDELPLTTNRYINKEPMEGFSTDLSGRDPRTFMNYAQITSYDPTGSGRNDHTAIVGLYGGRINLYVYDRTGRYSSSGLDLGPAAWMGDTNYFANDNTQLFNAMNYIAITSGDYDGDGRDSLVVWACLDGTGYGLYEITTLVENEDERSGITFSVTYGLKSSSPDKALLHDVYRQKEGDFAAKETWVDNKLCAAVDTGDFNGDGIDDLAVLSYVSKLTSSYDGRSQNVAMYRPLLAVSYGAEGSGNTAVTSKADLSAGVWNAYGSFESAGAFDSCVAAGLSAGDSDADGRDEIVVAGIRNTIEGPYGGSADSPYNIDTDRLTVAVFDGTTLGTRMFDSTMETNEWTRGGFYSSSDDAWQQTAVRFVYINGRSAPGFIFINGDLYRFTMGASRLELVLRPEYFQHDDEGAGSAVITNAFFSSVAAGNIDGNNYGFEQVAFGIGLKSRETDNYRFTVGVIGGTGHDPYSGIASSYVCTSMDFIEDGYFPFSSGYGVPSEPDDGRLNFLLCTADIDYDGILARFAEKGYTYSDPDIMVVLQAAPYFKEVDKYAKSISSTSYSIKHSYNFSRSSGNSVSFGAGVVHSLDAVVAGYNLTMGYAMNWSENYTNTVSTSNTYRWSAIRNDSVVVYRTPVVLYSYQIQNNGEWNEEDTMVVSVPQAPTYTVLSIDDYNAFVSYYNETCRKLAEEKGITEDIPSMTPLEDAYLHHEGDPYGFHRDATGLTVLQSTPQTYGIGSSTTGFDWSKESSESYSVNWGHGFAFNFQLKFNLGIEGFVGSTLGGYVSLNYLSTSGTSTTTAEGEGIGCTVYNTEAETLEEKGLDIDTARLYRFDYQMARWTSNLTEKNGQPVPVIGYLITNLASPPPVVTDLKAEYLNEDDEYIRLTWSDPSTTQRSLEGYDVYVMNTSGEMEKVSSLPADATEFRYDGIDGRLEYRFQIYTKRFSDAGETLSLPSNTAYAFKEVRSIRSIDLTYSDATMDVYTVTFSDGSTMDIEVKKGKGIVSIDPIAISPDGLTVTYRMTFTDETYTDYEIRNGRDGVGIVSVSLAEETLNTSTYRVVLSNGKSFSFDVVNGKDGINGKDGVNGKDGIGIDSLRIDDNGILSVRYSDGTSQSLGRVGAAPIIEVPGEIARYYFDVPYDDFSGISIRGKAVDPKFYKAEPSGNGTVVTISMAAVPAGASRMETTYDGNTSYVKIPGTGVPWWLLVWNIVLTAGGAFLIWDMKKKKKDIF